MSKNEDIQVGEVVKLWFRDGVRKDGTFRAEALNSEYLVTGKVIYRKEEQEQEQEQPGNQREENEGEGEGGLNVGDVVMRKAGFSVVTASKESPIKTYQNQVGMVSSVFQNGKAVDVLWLSGAKSFIMPSDLLVPVARSKREIYVPLNKGEGSGSENEGSSNDQESDDEKSGEQKPFEMALPNGWLQLRGINGSSLLRISLYENALLKIMKPEASLADANSQPKAALTFQVPRKSRLSPNSDGQTFTFRSDHTYEEVCEAVDRIMNRKE